MAKRHCRRLSPPEVTVCKIRQVGTGIPTVQIDCMAIRLLRLLPAALRSHRRVDVWAACPQMVGAEAAAEAALACAVLRLLLAW